MNKTFIILTLSMTACGVQELPNPSPTLSPKPVFPTGSHPTLDYDLQVINQGQLSDCWFEASLAAIAYTKPGVLDNAIITNADGSWTVTNYNLNDELSSVVVNSNDINSWMGNYLNDDASQQLNWPAIFEIAYNKQNPNDSNNLKNGYIPFYAFAEFTMVNMITMNDFTTDQTALIQQATTYPTTVDTKAIVANPILVPSHVYAVLGLEGENVLLFNPWGENNQPYVNIGIKELSNNFSIITQAQF